MNGLPDIENELFTGFKAAILATTPTARCSGVEEDRPASFPFVLITEKSNTNYLRTADSGSREHHAQVMYEVNYYDNAISGKKANVKKMVKAGSEYMASLGFNRTFCQPVTNVVDVNVYRMTARYEAVIDEDKHTYIK